MVGLAAVLALTATPALGWEVSALVARSEHTTNWQLVSPQGPMGTVFGAKVAAVQQVSLLAFEASVDGGWSDAHNGGPEGAVALVVGPGGDDLRLGVGIAQLAYRQLDYRRDPAPTGATKYFYPRTFHATLAGRLGSFVASLFLDQGLPGTEYTTSRFGLTVGVHFR